MANHYVREAATGAADGSDWTNAWTDLPSTLTRGDTYYIADGDYGSHTYDDAESSTSVITIKKATTSDHGTSTGWDDSYAAGQAVFTGTQIFERGYYTLDGQEGGGPSSWYSGHGLKYTSVTAAEKIIDIRGTNWYTSGTMPTNLQFLHIEVEHRGRNTGTKDDGIYTIVDLDVASPDEQVGSSDVTIAYCYLHDFGRLPINTAKCDNWLLEYSCVARNTSSTEIHAEGWQDFGSNNITIRYNLFEDIEGTGVIALKRNFAVTNHNWFVHGNIFKYTPENRSTLEYELGQGVFTMTNENTGIVENLYFYHNSCVNLTGYKTGVWFTQSVNVKVKNNIWYYCDRYFVGSDSGSMYFAGDDVEWAYNVYSDAPLRETVAGVQDTVTTGDPFIDWENNDFALSTSYSIGLELDSLYNTDMLGNTRTNWTRGALELEGGGTVTEVIRYVDPDATGTGDGTTWANAYTTLLAWNTAEASDIAAAEEVHRVYVRSSGGTKDSSIVNVTGWTTSADYYVVIEDYNQTYILQGTAANHVLTLTSNYINVLGLTINPVANAYRDINVVGTYAKIEKCCLTGSGTTANYGVYVVGANCAIKDNLIMGIGRDGIQLAASSYAVLYNNNIMGSGRYGIYANYSTFDTIINNVIMESITADYYKIGGSTVTIGYNATSDGSTGTMVPYDTSTFVSVTPGSEDFNPVSGSLLIAAGIGPNLDSEVLLLSYGGGARSGDTCSIGAYEYISSGGAALPPQIIAAILDFFYQEDEE